MKYRCPPDLREDETCKVCGASPDDVCAYSYQQKLANWEDEARKSFEEDYLQAHLRVKNPNAEYLERTDRGGYFQNRIHREWSTFRRAWQLCLRKRGIET